MDYLTNILTRLRASLWLVPGVMSAIAVLVAWLLLFSGINPGFADAGQVWWIFSGDAATARDLMSTLLSAMITMTSLVVSITMVVLSLAAGQLGPRLILNFMEDREIQGVLGLFTGTIVYCLFVLRSINDAAGEVPHLAVTLGSFLSLLCVFALLFYIHKIARSIIADTVVTEVAEELESAIATAATTDGDATAGKPIQIKGKPAARLSLAKSGYVQVIEFERLVQLAEQTDSVIRLNVRAGHFLLQGDEHLEVHTKQALPEDFADKARRAFVVGHERTSTQDVEYSVRQLVEVAVRALSPGINDTFTAIAVVNRLAAAMEQAAARPGPPSQYRDADGTLRVIAVEQGFKGLMDAAFNQIRQAAADNPAVLIRMAHLFSQLAEVLEKADHRAALKLHIDKLTRAAKANLADPVDREDFLDVIKPALATLSQD